MSEQIDTYNFTQEEMNIIAESYSINLMLYQYKLTAEFCVKYILSTDDYASSAEDSYFDVYDVLRYQQHLTMKDITDAYKKIEG
jgi:hypothetical protein